MCYDVPEYNSTCAQMNQTDPMMCLQMSKYTELVQFASTTGLKLVFGLNAVWSVASVALESSTPRLQRSCVRSCRFIHFGTRL